MADVWSSSGMAGKALCGNGMAEWNKERETSLIELNNVTTTIKFAFVSF